MNIQGFKRQNRHLLWLLMEHSIGRYLLSNSCGRLNGYEKAEQHINLSAIFLASKLYCSIDQAKSDDRLIAIHDATQKLTDHMDKEIGFPIYTFESEDNLDNEYDYETLGKKFFVRFIELAEEKWKEMI